MPANKQPIFTLTPNVGMVTIPTTTAVTTSDGVSSGTGVSNMYKVFTTGANGSFLDRVRFYSIGAVANTTGVATTLRVFLSTVNSAPSATTAANTFLLGEVSVPAIASANSLNAVNYYEVVLGIPIQAGYFVLVTQHVAQTTNQNWIAMAFGGDY